MKILKSNLNRLQDPTQQGRNRAGAMSQAELITTRISRTVADFISSVPVEATDSGFIYLLPDGAQPNANFEDLFLAALLIDGSLFMDRSVEGAFRSGVLTTERDLEAQIEKLLNDGDTSASFNFDSVFGSQKYLDTLNFYQNLALENMNSIAKETASRVAAIIALGMQAGLSVEEILKKVNEQMEIMNSKMDRVITTTINQGLNQSKMISVSLAALALGLTDKVIHISALLDTTRAHHAARHQNVYTVAEQDQWWAEGANRINCYCTVQPVLIP